MNTGLKIFKNSAVVIVLASILFACGGGSSAPDSNSAPIVTTPEPSAMGSPADGMTFFNASQTQGNQFSCANCHGIDEDSQGLSTADSLHRPAHPLFNAINRSSFYNNNASTIFDATNICLENWMDTATLSESDQNWLDLEAYFEQQSDGSAASVVSATQVMPITDFSDADLALGQTRFNQTCATCHGQNAAGGTGLAASLIGRNLTLERVAEKARTSGPSTHAVFAGLTGGNMPFWSQERLNDTELKNIAAYVSNVSMVNTMGGTCADSDHELVGKVATLSTLAHDVSGMVEVINNCTLRVTQFNYDGEGPAVRFYLGNNGDYSNDNNAIGPQLNGQAYSDETFDITFTNPDMLDDIDGISVWCFEFNASFGEGLFL